MTDPESREGGWGHGLGRIGSGPCPGTRGMQGPDRDGGVRRAGERACDRFACQGPTSDILDSVWNTEYRILLYWCCVIDAARSEQQLQSQSTYPCPAGLQQGVLSINNTAPAAFGSAASSSPGLSLSLVRFFCVFFLFFFSFSVSFVSFADGDQLGRNHLSSYSARLCISCFVQRSPCIFVK